MRIRIVRLFIAPFLVVLLMSSGLLSGLDPKPAYASAYQSTKYLVYCVDGRVEVGSLSLEEMKSSRGENVCKLTEAEYDTLAKARAAAKRFGGVGAPCSCP